MLESTTSKVWTVTHTCSLGRNNCIVYRLTVYYEMLKALISQKYIIKLHYALYRVHLAWLYMVSVVTGAVQTLPLR